MSNNYYCYICRIFFDAPHSERVGYTEHIHISDSNNRCIVCRKRNPKPIKTYNTPLLDNLNALRTEKIRHEEFKVKEEQSKQRQWDGWFKSLTKEQVDELKRRTTQV